MPGIYILDLKCPPKVHVLRAESLASHYLEVVELHEMGPSGSLSIIGDVPSNGDHGTPVSSSFSFVSQP
jgi:hypothetical protein